MEHIYIIFSLGFKLSFDTISSIENLDILKDIDHIISSIPNTDVEMSDGDSDEEIDWRQQNIF